MKWKVIMRVIVRVIVMVIIRVIVYIDVLVKMIVMVIMYIDVFGENDVCWCFGETSEASEYIDVIVMIDNW